VAPAQAPIAPLLATLPKLRQSGALVVWLNWGNRPDRRNLSPALLHVYKPSADAVGLGEALRGDLPDSKVLEKGSWNAAIVEPLKPEPEDVFVDKFRMSGFWDTPLDSILRNAGITTVLFGGVNADQCVMATLMDANFLGYDTILLEDCSATTSPRYCWDATIYNVRQCFGFTSTSLDLMRGLGASES
jgi:nicotinamidase-related amidase